MVKQFRSRMNVVFRIGEGQEALEKEFVKQAEAHRFIGVAGHRSVGGLRVSLYNAVSLESCQKFARFMLRFQKTAQAKSRL